MAYLLGLCAAVYATLFVSIAIQSRKRANIALAISCGVTSVWSAFGAIGASFLSASQSSAIDLMRMLAWFCYLLLLYSQSGAASQRQLRVFTLVAAGAFVAGLVATTLPSAGPSYTLYSWPIALRLIVCVCELLLIENLYLNLPESKRWHITLPCIFLGCLACFDILVTADTALFHRPSVAMETGRVIAMIVVAPLLVLAAFRGQRWSEPVRLSRAAAFHSATLVLSGSVLLSLALAGEIMRGVDEDLGWIAEISFVFVGLVLVMLFLSSRSAKSFLDRMVVGHFFADRFDYRKQWLNCIATLSGEGFFEQTTLHNRAIRAVADVVDSPSGLLFLKDPQSGRLSWADSWNMPLTIELSSSSPMIAKLGRQNHVFEFAKSEANFTQDSRDKPWLAVPLRHSTKIVGLVIVGQPRALFHLDQEVFDLLNILGQEVGTYIAEQQAAEAVTQTRSLLDYGKRFAFVAHDIKNLSSQLTLILSNAERHIANPEFQRDMLETVRSSVQKIDRLIGRLDKPAAETTSSEIDPVSRLEALVEQFKSVRSARVTLEHTGPKAWIAMSQDAFDAAISHLLNNAIEAASSTSPVRVMVRALGEFIEIEIEDRGCGMSADFIRDELFSPLKTRRVGGSGIGAYQARELITEAGGELSVISEKGVGTRMQITFVRTSHATNLTTPVRSRRSEGVEGG